MINIIYKKYKKELDNVKRIMKDDYLYNMWYNYGFKLNNKFIQLDSNINIYEACFINLLINNYIHKYKLNNSKINVLELGLAYGTSSIVILNKLINYKGSISYDVVDPNQSKQWNNIGINHIFYYLKLKKNKNIKINLYEDYSQNILKKFKKKYDIIFIDGSHDENIVIQDFINSDKLLKKDGIMDDIQHTGVKNALQIFLDEKKDNYKKTIINDNENNFKYINIFNKSLNKKNIYNSSTMYCYQKII
jgi:predicted O-methyltransferase YrrM